MCDPGGLRGVTSVNVLRELLDVACRLLLKSLEHLLGNVYVSHATIENCVERKRRIGVRRNISLRRNFPSHRTRGYCGIRQNRSYCAEKRAGIDGLAYVCIHSCIKTLFAITLDCIGRERDPANRLRIQCLHKYLRCSRGR